MKNQCTQWGDLTKCGLYPLDELTEKEFHSTHAAFSGYRKIQSMMYISLLGLPRIKGIVITQWNPYTKNVLKDSLKRQNLDQFIIRSDRKDEVPNAPALGFLITFEDLDRYVKMYLKDDRVLILLLESRSRYNTLYSFNLLFRPEIEDRIHTEIVGPGFDASDLQRGQVTPHETIWLPRPRQTLLEHKAKRQLLSASHYQSSVTFRLQKVAKEIALSNGIDVSSWSASELEELATDYLYRTGQILLIQHRKEYPPIPFTSLHKIYDLTVDLPSKMRDIGAPPEPLVLSGSILNPDYKLVFWDIVWPRLKYESLSPLVSRQ